jgi:hypothetical protein
MGTQRVQMKGVPSWLVSWACRAGSRYFCPALPSPAGPAQNIFFLTVHYFNSFVPHRPARWAGSRDWSPLF